MRSYIYKALASACIFAAVSCEDNLITESQQDKELKAAVEQYVPNVIYNIYGKLADSSEELYKQISALKASDISAVGFPRKAGKFPEIPVSVLAHIFAAHENFSFFF